MSYEVGFIGAGQMGEPMVHRLLDAGVRVRVFVRDEKVGDRLRAHGATLASSLVELARESDIVICCMFSDAQLVDVALTVDGIVSNMKPGAVFVSHTTGSVDTLHRIADEGRERGISVLDAPVSGTAADIAEGGLTIMLGGDEASTQRVNPILASYGNPILLTGPLGSALNVKLVNNLLFAANLQLVADAVRLGAAMDIDSNALLRAIAHCSGSSEAVRRAVDAGGVEAFADIAKPFLRKDIAVCTEVARETGTDTGLIGRVAAEGLIDLTTVAN